MGHSVFGELTLGGLRELGEAAVRAISWVSEMPEDVQEGLGAYSDALVETRGDLMKLKCEPPAPLVCKGASWGENEEAWWHVELWAYEESENIANRAGWCLVAGKRQELFVEIELVKELDSFPFRVVMESTRDNRGATPLDSFPQMLKWRTHLSRNEFRRTLQGLDALTRHPVVVIDPSWRDDHLCESVMAQTAEWLTRTASSEHFSNPDLSEDALEWLRRWAQRIVGGRYAVSLSDVADVVLRSVRPSSAAGHRLYWRRSLVRGHDDSALLEAARIAGISRRTAYYRLKSTGKRSSDFSLSREPEKELASFLLEHAPRRLPEERRLVIAALRQAGMKSEAARKLERRIRDLPTQEQARRARAAIERAKLRKKAPSSDD